MAKNNKAIYLILLILVTISMLAVATYAYFTSRVELNANVPINLVTAKDSVFTAVSDSNIQIDIDYPQMSSHNVSANHIATDNATITVRLDSEMEDEGVICTYDLVWVWDSNDKYTEADIALPHTEEGTTYNYEFSTKIDDEEEKDLSTFTWQDVDGKKEAILTSKEIYLNQKGTTTNTHQVDVNVYNIPVHQAILFGKSFKAHIEVKNNKCEAGKRYVTLANHIKTGYEKDGPSFAGANGKLYLHDTNLANSAEDNSYRYAGADPNNYVCFTKDCTDDDKYRIIGVFGDETKLIKHTKLTDNMAWATSNSNTWQGSSLETYLNNETSGYLGSIKEYKSMIADTNWVVSGAPSIEIYSRALNTAKRTYDFEVAEACDYCGIGTYGKQTIVTLDRKIGLMYVSDYMYAAENNHWTRRAGGDEQVDYGNAKETNWLYDSMNYQWTISRSSENTNGTFYVYKTGAVGICSVTATYAVRPSFYLISSVKLIDGSGTSDDPYIVSL